RRGCGGYLGDGFGFLHGLWRLLPGQRVASIGNREGTADGHQQSATPNPVHERLVIDAHRPGASLDFIAEREIEIPPDAAIDCRFRSNVLRRSEGPLLRVHDGKWWSILRDFNVRAHGF